MRVDTTRRGSPDRRLQYDGEGRFLGLEVDPDGDGVFQPAGSGR
jgi:hypothetical protein